MNTRKTLVLLAGLALLAGLITSYCVAQPGPATPGGSPQPGPSVGPVGPMAGPGPMHAGPTGPGMHQAEIMQRMMKLVGQMQRTCFNPQAIGLIAVGGLKDEVRRKPDEIIQDLQEQLEKTKSLGLRNAIRLTLKDLYKAQGQDEEVLEQLREMLEENDAAIQEMKAQWSKRTHDDD
jgi:hypothetical protein